MAELSYVYIRPKYRRFGLGTVLLKNIERQLQNTSCAEFTVRFVKGMKETHVLEKFFYKSKFKIVTTDMFIYELPIGKNLLSIPWLKNTRLPQSFTIFPWNELTRHEQMKLIAGRNSWYPEAFDPLKNKDKINQYTSLGLKYNGEVIGWFITYHSDYDYIEYANLFTHLHFQTRGRGIALIIKAIQLQLQMCPQNTFIRFRVGVGNDRMLHFIQRRIDPFIKMAKRERVRLIRNINANASY